ncbi:MAG: hypothetical protein H6698_02785 [Myxococcales bacterium]|nr:hypothetical protein [Myxococcales bacterium]MCB9533240.1 hypothetical protein [Myxococcales bacterium]
MSTRRSALVLAALFAVAACGGETSDPTDSAGSDDAASDTSGDVAVCDTTEAPADGDVCDCEAQTYAGRIDTCDRSCLCEFGFWACTDDCDEVLPLALSWSSGPAIEELDGDGDAEVNPGETWRVVGSVAAANAPAAGAPTTVRVGSDAASVSIDAGTYEIEALTDEPQEFAIAFTVEDRATAGEVVLQVEAFSGFATLSDELTVTVVPAALPVLTWDDLEVLDAEGATALRIEAGDELLVTGVLSNEGTVAAEGVSVSLSSSSSSLATPDEQSVGVLAAGATRVVEFAVTVAASPGDLAPQLTFVADADNAELATALYDVTIYPPDTLSVVEHTWRNIDGLNWELVVTLQNTGRFALPGLEWRRVDYVSPPLPEGDPNRDDPFYATALGIGEPTGPGSLAAGATTEVTLPLTISAETPAIGRVLLRVTSDLRNHGPFALDVSVPLGE